MAGKTSTLALVAVLSLAACSAQMTVSRDAGSDRPALGGFFQALHLDGNDMVMVPTAYNVTRINVTVPHTLRVSEANSFVPIADIVWHGDPAGDRYLQVQTLLAEAAATGTKTMTVGPRVEVDMELTRFHALTPKARYVTGGNFATRFILTVRDIDTGVILDGPRLIVADCLASGGERAMEEEAAGITQKVVIEDHVAKVLARELSQHLVPKDQVAALQADLGSPDGLPVQLADLTVISRAAAHPHPRAQAVSRNGFAPGALTVAQ